MRTSAAVLMVLVSLAIAGCGGDDEKVPAKTGTTGGVPAAVNLSGNCPRVRLGVRDGDTGATFATIENPAHVDCVTAAAVARAWGRQRIGLGNARLPAGWACDERGVCRDGRRRFELVLVPPQ